jgi:hypothetical protein
MTSLVYMNLQDTDYARSIVDAIVQDNPHAEIQHQPSMIRMKPRAAGYPPRDGRGADRPRLGHAGNADVRDHPGRQRRGRGRQFFPVLEQLIHRRQPFDPSQEFGSAIMAVKTP